MLHVMETFIQTTRSIRSSALELCLSLSLSLSLSLYKTALKDLLSRRIPLLLWYLHIYKIQ